MTIRIKICGLTRVEDAIAAARAGVDAIGLVFVPRSSRCIDPDQARAIARALPPFVTRVGLFMNAPAADVSAILERVPVDVLQFHGHETPAFCDQFGRPWIKALTLDAARTQDMTLWEKADALLIDAHAGSDMGGSGQSVDWTRVPDLPRPWILAGGLNPGNVARACQEASPAAVDVSSGVETRPGIKSDRLMEQFIQATLEVVTNG